MTKESFSPKGEDVLRDEAINEFGLDYDNEEHRPFVDKLVAIRLKDEKMKASLHEQKVKTQQKLKDMLKAKEFYKQGVKPKGAEGQESVIPSDDKAYFYAKGGSRTELKFIEKIMKAEGTDFNRAWKSDLFKAMKAENDAKIKSKESKLGPSGSSTSSKGGKPVPKTEAEKKFAEYFARKTEQHKKMFARPKN
jgi:hypothetical protein